MNKFICKTPDGTRDFLLEECELHNKIKAILTRLFAGRGYHEVITPDLEHFDLFSMDSAGLSQEEMYKLVGPNGHLLVLRPDITMPIARLVSARLREAPLPIRLSYTQKVFRVHPGYKGRSDEMTQSGVELIGAKGLAADLETIHLAAKSLEACGITDYKFEIGHAGLFKELVGRLDVDDAVREEIRLATESKNYSALEDILDTLPQSRAAASLKMLPRLFGDVSTLDAAKELFGSTAERELDYLHSLISALEPELGERISVDLGLVHRNNYYTGVVFRGYASGSGDTAVSGGRYDSLFGEFGLDLPAVGFAVDNNVLAGILLRSYRRDCARPKRLVYALPGYEMAALRHIDEKSGGGEICEMMDYSQFDKAQTDAAVRGADFIDLIGERVDTSQTERGRV